MSLRTRYFGGFLHYYDSATDETVLALCPVWFKDDFWENLSAPNADIWMMRGTGAATEGLVGSGSTAAALALTNANEVQLAGMDWGNFRAFVLNQKLIFEARVRFTVLPTGSVVACVGLCGNYNAAVDTVAESIWFRLDGSGAVTVETDDTANETTKVATGVTLVANQQAVLRIEIDDTAAVRFYIDGARVASGTTFNMSTVPALTLQPVARIGKEAGATTVGTMQVDYVACGQQRTP